MHKIFNDIIDIKWSFLITLQRDLKQLSIKAWVLSAMLQLIFFQLLKVMDLEVTERCWWRLSYLNVLLKKIIVKIMLIIWNLTMNQVLIYLSKVINYLVGLHLLAESMSDRSIRL